VSLKHLFTIFLLSFCIFSRQGIAVESGQQEPFKSGSYQKILDDHKQQPFALVIWSTTCPSCLKDMEILKTIHLEIPQFKFVMLTTDDLSDAGEVNKILEQQGLTDLESWILQKTIYKNFVLKLILDGMVNYREPIFLIACMNVWGLVEH
jgi:thiol-disulfide isomerase/thioredoxin